MVHYYHHFLPSAATVMQPLFEATAGKKENVTWSTNMEKAFIGVKEMLANATLLVHPRPDAQIAISTDASDIAIGGVLQQFVDGMWQPLAFNSRQLRAPERKWSTFDRELLRLHLAIRYFRYFVEGRHFVAFTDHQPLVHAFRKVSDPWSPRQQRHLSIISEYTTDVQRRCAVTDTQ